MPNAERSFRAVREAARQSHVRPGVWQDRRAVTAVEYGLLTALIALTIVTSLRLIGTGIVNTLTTISNTLSR